MPCLYNASDESYLYDTINEQKAMLCAVLSVLENTKTLNVCLQQIDWDNAGITRKTLENWWKEHKEEDAKRQKENKRELRKSALKKLSSEERKALGLGD